MKIILTMYAIILWDNYSKLLDSTIEMVSWQFVADRMLEILFESFTSTTYLRNIFG